MVALTPNAMQTNGHAPSSTDAVILIATKHQRLVGLTSPTPGTTAHQSLPSKARITFEAQLPRSLTRVRQGNIRPRWRARPPSGVLADGIVGVAADGSLMGISILDESLWRRLFWLQRLCEWSEKVSAHSAECQSYGVDEDDFDGEERGLPTGLSGEAGDEIALIPETRHLRPEHDMHIDGDVLARLLKRGGAETLREVIREMAVRQDRVGQWIAAHLEDEIEAVEGVVEEMRVLLESWI